ncbi:winged helix-turn-helix transcriptional regulator [Nocardia salmonicida]|uniref:winged helix-turn-helix transcriptional regulator n=1 Tax=Nocardia salmonicida TaxID=53431 RepID=UPI0036260D40
MATEDEVRAPIVRAMRSCPVEVSIAVLGGAWKMTIVKYLLDEPLRYGELRRKVGEVTPRVLTRQLRELEQDGIVNRHAFAEVPPRVEYSLTATGKALRGFVTELNRWGAEYIEGLAGAPVRRHGALRIGVTGHTNITADTVPIVRAAIADLIAGTPNLVGISCLARGADSVFAEAVLDAGGHLEVVLPSRDYREAKVKPDALAQFDTLIERATTVRVMDFDTAGREAYEAANEVLVGEADRMIAVWDGEVGARAGTGTVVALARERGVPVDVVWPRGAERG